MVSSTISSVHGMCLLQNHVSGAESSPKGKHTRSPLDALPGLRPNSPSLLRKL